MILQCEECGKEIEYEGHDDKLIGNYYCEHCRSE